ncbi:MAG: methionyl-tRNA formyltransferase [Spirochaetales bacterium]|nr:methionyl-tRNA formyltransferase [Spirochaetales bacterium]
MKIIFFGTPELAVQTLNKISASHEVVMVVTQPDALVGRKQILTPSPIAVAADELKLPVLKPEKLTNEVREQLSDLNADLFVTFAYGKIFKAEFLKICPKGGINIHPSLLPLYRGASPIQSALLNGESRSGISIQQIALEVDSGDIFKCEEFSILPEDDAITIEEKVAVRACDLIEQVLGEIENGTPKCVKQDSSKATFCRMISKNDGNIDWNTDVNSIFNKIRAFAKWPVASTTLDGKKLNIHKAAISNMENSGTPSGTIICADKKKGIHVQCTDGVLEIKELQLAGKNKLQAVDFLNGYRNLAGKCLAFG